MTMHARHALTLDVWLLALSLLLSVSLVAAQDTFRTRTDIVQLDVSVLDGQRQPLTGLTAADFTVLEDGQVRPIEAFLEVNVPPPARPPAVWARDVPADVVSNQLPPSRIVVIVIDDFALLNSQEPGMWSVLKTRETVRRVIDELGPQDLSAVVFSLSQRTAQSLTTDRTKLLTSLESSQLFPGTTTEADAEPDAGLNERGDCYCGLCSIDVLREAAMNLGSIAGQRKTIIYVSPGVPMVLRPMAGSDDCYAKQTRGLEEAFRQAQLANVTIYPFDPRGLRTGSTMGRVAPGGSSIDPRLEFLRNVAETTGARAVVGTNDPDLQVAAVMAETRSYYLVGFRPSESPRDGRLRRLEVRVNQRGAEVHTRKGFFADAVPAASEQSAQARSTSRADPAPATSDLQPPAVRTALDAVTNPLVPRGDFPVRASAFAFADANGQPAAAIVVGVDQPGVALTQPLERVEVAARAATPSGRLIGTRRQTLELTVDTNAKGLRQYEVFSRLPLTPGRYEIRLGVLTEDARSASVYVHLDVPDFARARLEASGLVLNVTPALANGPKSAFGDLLPLLPTTRREFLPADEVTAFLRVYQGGNGVRTAPSARSEILDAAGAAVLVEATPLERVAFLGIGASDYRLRLPLARLSNGEHLLKVTIMAGEERIERFVRFSVQR